jgi:hypothetical protein
MPTIVEADAERGRVLVRFEQFGSFGVFGGTGLYAREEDGWEFYEIPPRASASIAEAEAWLAKQRAKRPAAEPVLPAAPPSPRGRGARR